jgi:hypothetical protein
LSRGWTDSRYSAIWRGERVWKVTWVVSVKLCRHPAVGDDEAHGGDDLVGFAGQTRQEGGGFATGTRFSEHAGSQGHLGIGAEDESLREAEGDGPGFGGGVGEADLARGQVRVIRGVLGDIGDFDLERDVELAEQIASTWGGGGEDEGGRFQGRDNGLGPVGELLRPAGSAGVAAAWLRVEGWRVRPGVSVSRVRSAIWRLP